MGVSPAQRSVEAQPEFAELLRVFVMYFDHKPHINLGVEQYGKQTTPPSFKNPQHFVPNVIEFFIKPLALVGANNKFDVRE